MKYQNNAINFVIKYNGTIREIKSIQKQIFKSQIVQNDLQQYYQMIKKLELSKQVRIKKFLSYIDDISKKK
jgi:hypothetical protein